MTLCRLNDKIYRNLKPVLIIITDCPLIPHRCPLIPHFTETKNIKGLKRGTKTYNYSSGASFFKTSGSSPYVSRSVTLHPCTNTNFTTIFLPLLQHFRSNHPYYCSHHHYSINKNYNFSGFSHIFQMFHLVDF